MSRTLHVVAVLAALAAAALAPLALAQSHDDVRAAPSCTRCGMDREKFAHSRMLVEYEDGTSVGLCSVHCGAVELAVALDRTPRAIRVADHGTRKLVDAEKAVWVLGGSVPGVMTRRAKWAFEQRAAADAFVQANGGTVVAFDEAMRAASEDLYQDTRMIREKRKAMRARQAAGAQGHGGAPHGATPAAAPK